MKTKLAFGIILVGILSSAAGYKTGKLVTERWYDAEPDVTCSGCKWEEVSSAGNCVKNCTEALEAPVSWNGDTPSCPTGFGLVADQAEAMAEKPSAHCVR